jgi:hypothetical protein
MAALTRANKRPRGRSRSGNNPPRTATHEIRHLRAQVAAMEGELHELRSKWANQLPDERTRASAQLSARQKHEVNQTEGEHSELQEMLLQQQLAFATLQTAVLHAPLHSSGEEILQALHFNTQLGRDPEEREKALLAHKAWSVATLPSLVDRISTLAVEKVLAHRKQGDVGKPVTPLSQVDVTGCKDGSLISSVFISEIPNTPLERVYEAVVAYFDGIPSWMKLHFGIDATRKTLNSSASPVMYWRLSLKGGGLPATVNHVLCSELASSHGLFHVDAITDDPLHPVSSADRMQFGLCGITLTPRKDAETGKTLSVTLRWLVVYRYNMLPNDPAIPEELEANRPILNGDLITSAICDFCRSSSSDALGTQQEDN